MNEPRTCPNCGALTTPQLVRCRRCQHYLHGTRLEGILFGALPGPLARSPGTGLMLMSVVMVWLAMVAATGFDGLLVFSGYSLRQLGALHVPYVLDHEWWRFGSSMLGHANLVHLVFNGWALITLGSIAERLYGRHKAWIVFALGGVLSMAGSFVWNAWLASDVRVFATTIGASGAVCALLGVSLVRAYRARLQAATKALGRWAIYLALFGLLVPGIDNAAHLTGFVVGALMGVVLRPGLSESRGARIAWSAAFLLSAATLLGCMVMAFVTASAHPTTLEADAEGSSLLGIQVHRGVAWSASTQRDALGACVRAVEQHEELETIAQRCEFSRRASPFHPISWRILAEHYAVIGDGVAARRYEQLATRFERVTLAGPSD